MMYRNNQWRSDTATNWVKLSAKTKAVTRTERDRQRLPPHSRSGEAGLDRQQSSPQPRWTLEGSALAWKPGRDDGASFSPTCGSTLKETKQRVPTVTDLKLFHQIKVFLHFLLWFSCTSEDETTQPSSGWARVSPPDRDCSNCSSVA